MSLLFDLELRMLKPLQTSSARIVRLRSVHSQHGFQQRITRTCLSQHPPLIALTAKRARAFRCRDIETQRLIHTTTDSTHAKRLPLTCPGCGAPSQTIDDDAPGFYNLSSNRTLSYFGVKSRQENIREARRREDEIFRRATHGTDWDSATAGHVQETTKSGPVPALSATPICDRCHALKHQSKGESIIHPSIESIQAMIEESPFRQNHIYHVVDAADFPMSLIPNLARTLDLPHLRTRNRRSKSIRYAQGRAAEVSFIITRSDLLAPKKEQVDSMMPYLQAVLRESLGRDEKQIRLGNVRCVSAKRGWWTKAVKEEIWDRGGAGWMVGKVNVGKSALYEAVFPKGRVQSRPTPKQLDDAPTLDSSNAVDQLDEHRNASTHSVPDEMPYNHLDETSLLPPPRAETAYPEMPIVSPLPGTTASPIRIPFGNGKGELIDLPGIYRSQLEEFVKPEFHSSMIMKHRVEPESQTLKPGQSLLLGGLVRITPQLRDDEELIFMAYSFVPEAFAPHVTGTHKAIAIQTGIHSSASKDREGEIYTGRVTSIATDRAQGQISSAGIYPLEWDVTKRRAGPLTDRAAGKMKTERLPFIVYSTDILIEGVGWVELTCQVRKSASKASIAEMELASDPVSEEVKEESLDNEDVPLVEVFSPTGAFVASRRPMNAWEFGGPKKVAVHERRKRPRQTIGMKKRQGLWQTNKS